VRSASRANKKGLPVEGIMPTGVKNVLVSLAFAALLASLAGAQSFDDEIKFYLNSGETHDATSVTAEGKSFRVVRVNNQEAFVFNESLFPVRDEALLRGVIDAYVLAQFERQPPIDVSGIGAQYQALNASLVGACLDGVDLFFTYVGPGSAWFFIYIQQSIKPKQWAATLALNQSGNLLKAAVRDLNRSLSELPGAVSAKDVERIYTNLGVAYQGLTAINNNFTTLSQNYRVIAEGDASEPGYPYAFGGGKYNCNLTTNITNPLNSLIQLTNRPNPFDKAQILSRIQQATAARAEPAQVRKVYDARVKQYEAVKLLRDKVASGFALLGVTLTFIGNVDAKVVNKLAAVANATTRQAAETAGLEFETENNAFKAQITHYETLLTAYNATKFALSNASAGISSATAKYGTSDARIQALNSENADITQRATILESDLKAGRTVEASRIQALTREAEALAKKSFELRPLEASLDIVLIGGVIVVILIVASLVWYARKRKKEQQELG
jgi:hypothetical protein